MKKDKVSVVIPIYKSELNKFEILSLNRCLKILGKYPIKFFCPENLNIESYQKINSGQIQVIKFENGFFEGIDDYNKLLLSKRFYNAFLNYEYILIYQLDSYVFKDDLEYWCNKDFDYIGAPWIDINIFKWFYMKPYPLKLKLLHKMLLKGKFLKNVGNGGLSLRKVDSFIKNLSYFNNIAKNWKANEDSFWSHYVGTFNPFFRIPSATTALNFSFDYNPEKCFKLNNNQFPFACHAWNRDEEPYIGNLIFWKDYILG